MKKFIKILVIIIILITLILLYSRFIATKGLKVKEYKIVNAKITDIYHGLKIVHISDIHYGSTIGEKELETLTNEINAINPDILVFTGDLIDEFNKYDKDILIKHFSAMEAKLGRFAIIGNHDIKDDFDDIMKQSGWSNLNDTYELIYSNSNEPIIISGISTNYFDSSNIGIKTEKLDNYIANLTPDDIKPIYSILLIHEPDFIDSLNMDNYDLVLSGHSHGGQIRLPIIGKLYTPYGSKKYYDAYYKVNNTDVYISSGLGTSKLKFRLFDKPSVNFYRITKNS